MRQWALWPVNNRDNTGMAKYQKGQSGNPNGRPKGAENKVTKESRELFKLIMDGEVPHIEEALGLLRENSPEKYLKALASLFPYFMPKKLEADVTVNDAPKEPSWFKDVIDKHDGGVDENLT